MFCRSDGARLIHQPLPDELISTEQRDVDTRSRLVQEGRLSDGYADEMEHVHRENAHRLNHLVSQHGWRRFHWSGSKAAELLG
jgi:hypothetical protein